MTVERIRLQRLPVIDQLREDLTRLLLKYEHQPNLPFMGTIRRYLHSENEQHELVVMEFWETLPRYPRK